MSQVAEKYRSTADLNVQAASSATSKTLGNRKSSIRAAFDAGWVRAVRSENRDEININRRGNWGLK